MSNFRSTLLDRMIRIYGYEHPIVIEFCRICENYPSGAYWDKSLAVLVQSHERYPILDEEE